MLAASPANRLVIMPGNHDPDFFWPGVQQDFRALLAKRSPVSAEQMYSIWSPPARRPPTRGSGSSTAISTTRSTALSRRQRDLVGSPSSHTQGQGRRRAAVRVHRHAIPDQVSQSHRLGYPLVDNVKPFSRFLRVFGGSAFVAGYGTLKVALAVAAMLRFLTGTAVRRPSDLLGVGEDTAPALAVRLRTLFQSATGVRKKQFLAGLQERGFGLGGQDLECCSTTPGVPSPCWSSSPNTRISSTCWVPPKASSASAARGHSLAGARLHRGRDRRPDSGRGHRRQGAGSRGGRHGTYPRTGG